MRYFIFLALLFMSFCLSAQIIDIDTSYEYHVIDNEPIKKVRIITKREFVIDTPKQDVKNYSNWMDTSYYSKGNSSEYFSSYYNSRFYTSNLSGQKINVPADKNVIVKGFIVNRGDSLQVGRIDDYQTTILKGAKVSIIGKYQTKYLVKYHRLGQDMNLDECAEGAFFFLEKSFLFDNENYQKQILSFSELTDNIIDKILKSYQFSE